ncbi:MAG: HU family DNA-binding protein [Halothece sp.]
MELTEYISNATGFNPATVSLVLDTFQQFVQVQLREKEKIIIKGFGTFSAEDKPERPGRNPRTGEEIIIPEKRKPKFKFSSTFVKAIQPDPSQTPIQKSQSSSKTPPPLPPDLIPSSEDIMWHISDNGKTNEVKQSELAGKVSLNTPLWSEKTGWKLAKDIPELAYLFS